METVLITKENRELFQGVIAPELMGEIENHNVIAMGAIDENTHEVLGASLTCITNNQLELLWIYVLEEYREQGYGRWILLQTISAAYGVKELTGVFAEYPRDPKYNAFDQLLRVMDFEGKLIESDIFTFQADHIQKGRLWQKASKPSGIMPLKDVPEIYLKQYSAYLSTLEDAVAVQLPVPFERYHQELSVAYVNGQGIGGVLLIEKEQEAFFIDFMHVKPQYANAFMALIYSAGVRASTLPPETNISVSLLNEKLASVITSLFPDGKTQMVIHREFIFAGERGVQHGR